MEVDSEIKAMSTIAEALSTLESGQIGRVLQWAAGWAAERHGVEVSDTKATSGPRGQFDDDRPVFDDLPTLFHEAQPRMEADKALVVGYWFQVVLGQKDFESQPLNAELKNLGHGVGNITDAMTTLMRRKPALVIQVQKSGTTRQARKRYKLTTAGIKQVEDMLQGLLASVG